jgi:hypothetical protein
MLHACHRLAVARFSFHSYNFAVITLQWSAGACSKRAPHAGPCPQGCEAHWKGTPDASASGAGWCPSPHGSMPGGVQCLGLMLCNLLGSQVVAVEIINIQWLIWRKYKTCVGDNNKYEANLTGKTQRFNITDNEPTTGHAYHVPSPLSNMESMVKMYDSVTSVCSWQIHTLEPERKISDSCLARPKIAPSTNLSGKDSNSGGTCRLRVSGRCRMATDRA